VAGKDRVEALPIEWDEGNERHSLERIDCRVSEGGLDAEQAFVGTRKVTSKVAITNAAKTVEAVYSYP